MLLNYLVIVKFKKTIFIEWYSHKNPLKSKKYENKGLPFYCKQNKFK